MSKLLHPQYSPKRRFGNFGEKIACEFLRRRGFEIIEQNYLRKWGEIDIIAVKQRLVHFIEVKTVSCREMGLRSHISDLQHQPESGVDRRKVFRMKKAINSFLLERGMEYDEVVVDVIGVVFYRDAKIARVRIIENVVL